MQEGQKESSVNRELSAAEKQVKELLIKLDVLGDKLVPVLSPAIEACGQDDKRQPPGVPMAARIFEISQITFQAGEKVAGLTQRLEV